MFNNASFKESMKSLYPAIGSWVIWWSIKLVPQSKFLRYLFKHFVLNSVPLLLSIFNEHPNWEYTLSIYACITSSDVLVFKGIQKTYPVNMHITVRAYWCFLLVRRMKFTY